MENNITLQDNSSWFAVIGGACGIIILFAYILWGPEPKDTSSVMPKQQIEIQQKYTELTPAADRR